MDFLDWGCYPASSSWSNHEVAEAYNGVKFNGDLPEDNTIFNQIQQLHTISCTTEPQPILSESHQLQYYSNPEKILTQMVRHLAPSLDSIIGASNPNHHPLSQTEAMSVSEDPELRSTKRPYNVMMENTLSGLMAENNAFFKSTAPTNTAASLESLDCLVLSATNSNTDTSVLEDDAINSIFFSDKNLVSKSISKKRRRVLEKPVMRSSNISFQQASSNNSEADSEAMAQMKEMMYRAAAFRPVSFGDEVVEKPKRKNVRISSDPQTAAARQRREKISEKMRVLQRLVPGGSKMDTATMLDEAANYLNFLRSQVTALEKVSNIGDSTNANHPVAPFSMQNNFS